MINFQISYNFLLRTFSLLIAIMTDERSPLLKNRRERDGEIDYSAVNEPEQIDSVAIHGSSDAEQQHRQTVVAPQNSVITLVRLGNFRDYLFYSNTAFGQR